jgi:hypothetical protein
VFAGSAVCVPTIHEGTDTDGYAAADLHADEDTDA